MTLLRIRRWRCVLLLVLPLLVFAQHRTHAHALEHVAHRHGDRAGHATFATAEPQPCMECGLLAGGFAALPCAIAGDIGPVAPRALVFGSYRSRAGELPAWFESRAPPRLP